MTVTTPGRDFFAKFADEKTFSKIVETDTLTEMFARCRKFGLERICIAAGHRLVVTEHLFRKLLIDLSGCAAVLTVDIALDLLADRLVRSRANSSLRAASRLLRQAIPLRR